MPKEIERKFLVASDAWREGAEGERYVQGYLSLEPGRTVRVRVAGERAYLTIKGKAQGISRSEYEYEIPKAHAEEMLSALCVPPLIDKVRYKVPFAGLTWEVDVFSGENEGLTVAEVELTEEGQSFEKPSWVGNEVSDDPRYANSHLVRRPFRSW